MKHEFALYYADNEFNNVSVKSRVILSDAQFIHRVTHVIRQKVNEQFIIFTTTHVYTVIIIEQVKNKLILEVIEKKKSAPCAPPIYWLLPLLERAYFEEAVYNLAAMGAWTIQPVITEKSKSLRMSDRLNRIMIAACEQAKQFVIPEIKPVTHLDTILNQSKNLIVFDPTGKPCFTVLSELKQKKIESLTCLVGPEAGFSVAEQEKIFVHASYICALTPTILRAVDAVTVSMGIMRSCL